MVDNKKGFRMLIDLRNKLLLNQIDFKQFLDGLEVILYNYLSYNNVKLAGGDYLYCYSTIARRLLKDELGETNSLINLKIDLTY